MYKRELTIQVISFFCHHPATTMSAKVLVIISIAFFGTAWNSPVESFDFSLDNRRASVIVPPDLLKALIALQPVNETETKRRPLDSTPNCNCGVKGPDGRIVGGSVAGEAEWPWQAFLLADDSEACGGTVLSKNWVVTAAHCTKGRTKVMVYLGINNVDDPTTAKHISQASSVINHEKYQENADGTQLFDIALLQLKTPIPSFTKFIKPICLPYKFVNRDFQGEKATVTGWGRKKDGGPAAIRLREVTMPVLNSDTCGNSPYLYNTGTITSDMICTYREGVDACQGDSGGPLNWFSRANSRTYLIGVVSFGNGCAKQNFPGAYVKVTNFLTWINDQAGQSFCNR